MLDVPHGIRGITWGSEYHTRYLKSLRALGYQSGYSYRPLREEGEGRDPRVEKLIVYLHERWGNSSS